MNRIIDTKLRNQVLEWVEQDREHIISLFSQLVQCKTPSDPGDTRSAMNLIKQFLETQELAYQEAAATEIMPNLISSVEMNQPGRHLMFNGHLDVMPAGNEPGWSDNPWSGKIADGKVFGRGSSDMKAGVTAMLFAYTYVSRLRDHLSGKVSLTLVSDEETGYERGTGYLFEQMEDKMLADCVLSGEPSGIHSISFASKGYIQFTIRVKTRGAIAGYSNESPSAIEIAATIMRDLKALETVKVKLPNVLSEMLSDPKKRAVYEERRGKGETELLSKITVDFTTIKGGDLLSVIAPECTFTVAVVAPAGADPYLITDKAREIISHYPEAELFLDGISMADVSDPANEMVQIIQDTVLNLGLPKPEPVPDFAISDCRHWRYRGIPAFWYGPDGGRCSAANEYVEIEELLHIVRTHTLAAIQYLMNEAPKTSHKKAKKTTAFSDTPKIKAIPSVHAVYVMGIANSFKSADLNPVIDELINRLYTRINNAGMYAGATVLVEMKPKKIGGKSRIEVTVAFPIDRHVTVSDGLEIKEFSNIESAAVTVHRGTNDTSKSWNALCKWASENGYKNCGIYREYYIVSAPNPQEFWTTELQLPISGGSEKTDDR